MRCAIWSSALAIASAAVCRCSRRAGGRASQSVSAHAFEATASATPLSPRAAADRQSYCCQSVSIQSVSASSGVVSVLETYWANALSRALVDASSSVGANAAISGSGSTKCSIGGSSSTDSSDSDSYALSIETEVSPCDAFGRFRNSSIGGISTWTSVAGVTRPATTDASLVNAAIALTSGTAAPGTNGLESRKSDCPVTWFAALGVRCGTNGRSGGDDTTYPPSCIYRRAAQSAPERFRFPRAFLHDE